MPSSVRHNQPVARKKGRGGGPGQTCAAPGLRDTLEHIAGQIGDADKRHGSALADMQERLSQLTHKLDGVRAGFSKPDAAALERIEDGIDTLSEHIARLGEPQPWQRRSGGARRSMPRAPLRPSTGAESEAHWDAVSAEALTRVYETAEAELRRPSADLSPGRRHWAKVPPAPPAQAPWQGDEPDRAWLEARLAGIDTLLRQALDGVDPDKTLDAVKGRLDQFEARFDAALENVARRSDLEGLALLEAQLKELTRQFEQTREQLARLDSIDDGLRDLALGLERQRPPGELDSKAIETMIDVAADRAAARLAGALPATPSPDHKEAQKRVEALEGLLQDYIEERRRGEEVTASILHAIEDALVRIVDRVDAIDVAKPAPAPQEDEDHLRDDGLDIESERLAQAYAAGARVLGQGRAERDPSILDAADYTSFAPRDRERAASDEPAPTVAEAAEPDPEGAKGEEPRRSDLRTRLMPHSSASPGSQPRTDAGGAERGSSTAEAPRTRLGSRLAMLMLLLFGTGYLLVDVFMTNGPPNVGGQHPAALRAEARPGAEAADIRLDAGGDIPQSPSPARKSQLAAPPEGEPSPPDILAPRKPSRRVPETVTDDLSLVDPELGWRASSLEAAGHTMAAAFATTTAAVPQEPSVEPVPQGRTLLGRDHPRLLPAGIGPAALRNAAASGDPDAAFEVATRFAEGKGVTQDLKQALAWYQRAAAQGHASAQFRVAAFHERGIGVTADRERATLWYRRAAEQGHVKAMHNLAVLMVGKGAERADYATAARWFREAAERGLADSQYNLAALCEDGHGVARSLAEAYKWFALAARSGDRGAAQRQALIKARLNPGELAAAEQMVAAWRVRDAGAMVDAAGPATTGPDGAGD